MGLKNTCWENCASTSWTLAKLPRFFCAEILICRDEHLVFNQYRKACESIEVDPIGYCIFLKTWLKYCLHTTTLKSSDDSYDRCQENICAILHSQNMNDKIKNEKLKEAMEHLKLSEVHKMYYQNYQAYEVSHNSSKSVLVLSFDYLQNVYYSYCP